MSNSDFEQKYLTNLDGRARWYKRTADRTMAQFIAVRSGLVLASATLPALATLAPRAAILVSVLIAILAGLDTQFQWGEEWRHFRSTQMAVERLRRDYEMRRHAIENRTATKDITTHQANFAHLYQEAEDLLQSETDRFFRFRITPSRSPSSET